MRLQRATRERAAVFFHALHLEKLYDCTKAVRTAAEGFCVGRWYGGRHTLLSERRTWLRSFTASFVGIIIGFGREARVTLSGPQTHKNFCFCATVEEALMGFGFSLFLHGVNCFVARSQLKRLKTGKQTATSDTRDASHIAGGVAVIAIAQWVGHRSRSRGGQYSPSEASLRKSNESSSTKSSTPSQSE